LQGQFCKKLSFERQQIFIRRVARININLKEFREYEDIVGFLTNKFAATINDSVKYSKTSNKRDLPFGLEYL